MEAAASDEEEPAEAEVEAKGESEGSAGNLSGGNKYHLSFIKLQSIVSI